MKKAFVFFLCVMILFSWDTAALAGSEGETPSGVPLSGIESFIDGYMAKYVGKTTPGAAVVLVKDGEIIFSKGYGYANLEKKIPVDPAATVFEYGSISKLFVYTTIMRLSEAGKIDLNENIRGYLPPGFLKKLSYDQPITMLNIMNHTAGFEDLLFDIIRISPKKLPGLEQTLKNVQPKQVYKPGTVSAYSNFAVSLAAYIAERITGQEFYQYLMETIFTPLGMDHTSAHQTLSDKPGLTDNKASGYYSMGKGNFKLGPWSYIPIYPAGSVNGTAADLAQFVIALMPEEGQRSPLFNKRETLDVMFTQSHQMGPGMTGFSHGFFEWDGEYHSVGHGGDTAAFAAEVDMVPEKRFGVVILTNAAGEMDIRSGLMEALIGKRNKNITGGGNDLPSEKMVEGSYINARRMHSSFLELYGYLSLLHIKAMGPNKIKLSLAGQSSTLIQTRPYVYRRVEADGSIFKYHLGTVYFDVSGGKVQRISGDFLPLPAGRTMPWLIAYLIAAVICVIYFTVAPVILLARKLRRKKEVAQCRAFVSLIFCGSALIINNAVLIVRMLINNYRSFSEMRIHIHLNYPLAVLAVILSAALVGGWRSSKPSKWQRILHIITMVFMGAFIGILFSWKFFNVIA